MGCSQSKPTEVVEPVQPKDNAVTEAAPDQKPSVAGTQDDKPKTEESEDQEDEAPKTLEPIVPVIDTSVAPATEQAPNSTAVEVPESVRANFSSFNISFIDPTVSAPTSATTEPNVASARVPVVVKNDDMKKQDIDLETTNVAGEKKVEEPLKDENTVEPRTEEKVEIDTTADTEKNADKIVEDPVETTIELKKEESSGGEKTEDLVDEREKQETEEVEESVVESKEEVSSTDTKTEQVDLNVQESVPETVTEQVEKVKTGENEKDDDPLVPTKTIEEVIAVNSTNPLIEEKKPIQEKPEEFASETVVITNSASVDENSKEVASESTLNDVSSGAAVQVQDIAKEDSAAGIVEPTTISQGRSEKIDTPIEQVNEKNQLDDAVDKVAPVVDKDVPIETSAVTVEEKTSSPIEKVVTAENNDVSIEENQKAAAVEHITGAAAVNTTSTVATKPAEHGVVKESIDISNDQVPADNQSEVTGESGSNGSSTSEDGAEVQDSGLQQPQTAVEPSKAPASSKKKKRKGKKKKSTPTK